MSEKGKNNKGPKGASGNQSFDTEQALKQLLSGMDSIKVIQKN